MTDLPPHSREWYCVSSRRIDDCTEFLEMIAWVSENILSPIRTGSEFDNGAHYARYADRALMIEHRHYAFGQVQIGFSNEGEATLFKLAWA